jgi:phage tail-like protein
MESMATGTRPLFPVNRFIVSIQNVPGLEDASFEEVVLPEVTSETGSARRGKASFGSLVLQRALRPKSAFGRWMRDGNPADIHIWLPNEKGEPVIQWRALKAVPVRWSHSNLNAHGADVATESLELTVEEFDRVE